MGLKRIDLKKWCYIMRISRVKIRKCTRRTLLMRKKIVTVPEETTRNLPTSERSTTMPGDIGIDRIMSYVRSIKDPARFL